jgi:chromosomal replication initiator protein
LAEIERIKIYASSACHIRIENLRGDRRGKFARARHIAMYVARKATDVSYPELGRAFGRDHTTVIYAVRSVQKLVDAGDARVIRALNVIHASITR